MEKILSINEFHDKKMKSTEYGLYDGYEVKTTEQIILLGIQNEQVCCEEFGYMSTPDNIKEFEGAELISLAIVDKELNKLPLGDWLTDEDVDTMFVNLETSKGTLQLAVYNAHNGYYGHTMAIESKEINELVY